MHRFAARPKPAEFDAYMLDTVAALTSAVTQGNAPKFNERRWKRFAGALSQIQHGKCGYCESKVTNVTDPDVEHFSPKSEVAFLSDDPKDWGVDEPYLPHVKGRKKKILAKRGYWWLAYSWENYLLACGVCNRKMLESGIRASRASAGKPTSSTPLRRRSRSSASRIF
jgi:hypothetical protein